MHRLRAVVVASTMLGAVVLPVDLGARAAPASNVPGLLMAVTALAPDDVWAVGRAAHDASLIEHWDGSSWQRVDSPTLGRRTELRSVDAVSPTDIWAVGTWYFGKRFFPQPIIVHWDGFAWSQVGFVSTPFPTSLSGVAALSRTNVWVVGSVQSHSIAYQWDGQAWKRSKVKHRPRDIGVNGLADIDARDADTMWVVGTRQPDSDHRYAMAQSWQGDHWKLEQAEPLPHQTFAEFKAVTAVGPDLAWAVGFGYGHTGGMIQRWDGSSWSLVSKVWATSFSSRLDDVEASSENDAWAVGSWTGVPGSRPVVAHWDGSSWQKVGLPEVDGHQLAGYLYGVSVRAADDVWAVGWDPNDERTTAIILHWDGLHWAIMSS